MLIAPLTTLGETTPIDGSLFLSHLAQIGIAFALAVPVGWQREHTTRTMGLRTFPLVSVASCAYVLLAVGVVGTHADANSRIIQGLITGMGFIGGGAILKEGGGVSWTATAASIWTTGAVGSAVSYGRYEIALVVSLITFLVLVVLTPLERAIGKHDRAERAAETSSFAFA